jgi:fatty-acyl-CoA synthase
MSRFDSLARAQSSLYWNRAVTGNFVWKKDSLIDLTFPQVLDRMVEEFPDQYCLKYSKLDYTRTYVQFRDDVDRFARALIDMGVKPGDKVSIWATNVPQWYITFWAVTKIGAVLVTVNTAYKIREAEYLLRQSDTHTLVLIRGYRDSDYAGIVRELCPELEHAEPGKPLHAKRLPFLRKCHGGSRMGAARLGRSDGPLLARARPRGGTAARVGAQLPRCGEHAVHSGNHRFSKGVMLTPYKYREQCLVHRRRMDLSTADRMMIRCPCSTASRHGTGHDGTVSPTARQCCLCRISLPSRLSPALIRCVSRLFTDSAHDVYRHVEPRTSREDGLFLHAHRHHGGLSLSIAVIGCGMWLRQVAL